MHPTLPASSLPAAAPVTVTVIPDGFGAFSYDFVFSGEDFTCHDFPSPEEALSGADFHLRCLANGWQHEVADGLGAIFISHQLEGQN